MSAPDVLFFDLDGTITDPAPGIVGAVRHALARLDLEAPPPRDLRWVIGPPLRVSFPRLGVPAARVEEAVALYRDFYAAGGMYDARVYAGVEECLRVLRGAGFRLSVVTAKPHVFARPILERFGLAPYFEAVHGPELDGRNDHKGDLIREILAQRAMKPAAAIMIGDRANDINAARENGLAHIGVLWGYGTAEELRGAGAETLVSAPAALTAALLALRPPPGAP